MVTAMEYPVNLPRHRTGSPRPEPSSGIFSTDVDAAGADRTGAAEARTSRKHAPRAPSRMGIVGTPTTTPSKAIVARTGTPKSADAMASWVLSGCSRRVLIHSKFTMKRKVHRKLSEIPVCKSAFHRYIG